jgi:hypothetical protein
MKLAKKTFVKQNKNTYRGYVLWPLPWNKIDQVADTSHLKPVQITWKRASSWGHHPLNHPSFHRKLWNSTWPNQTSFLPLIPCSAPVVKLCTRNSKVYPHGFCPSLLYL